MLQAYSTDITVGANTAIPFNNVSLVKGRTAAEMVKKLIKDVDEELYSVEQYHLFKQAINYDMVSIVNEQQAKLNHYNSKICSFTFE